jgi:transcriptional regulator with XRE-family HTH domain
VVSDDNKRLDSAGLSPQAELARRLNLLLDVVVAERGQPVTFREVQAKLEDKGIKLSRARWFYMKDGTGRLVSDPALLRALCEIFNVDPTYLLGGAAADLPQRIDSQLEFVKSLRAARVKTFAARTLGDVSPETLQAITEYLNKDISRRPEGEQAATSSQSDPGEAPEHAD